MAPMAGITDLPFRLLCIEQDCALVFTEMISAKALYYNDIKTHKLLTTNEKERPIGIQIFGSDYKIISEVIKRQINDLPFDIVDLNCGCPAPKITKNGEGSSLMKNPKLIGKIVSHMVKSSIKPVTVKIRAGWDDDNINALEIAKIVEGEGAGAVTIHGRTREQFYSGQSNWDIITKIKEELKIPVIGNGDITNYHDAQKMLDITKCDGIMIGRGALGNPWIFKELISGQTQNIDLKTKITMINKHINSMLLIKPEHIVVREMRKHIAWYTKGLRNSTGLRNYINKVNNIEELKLTLENFLVEYKI